MAVRRARPLRPRRSRSPFRRAPLPLEERLLVSLATLVVVGEVRAVRRMLERAARSGVALPRVRETLLQSHLFAGFPRAIDAFERLAEVGTSGAFREGEVEPSDARGNDAARGAALFGRIYGDRTAAVRRTLAAHHPDLERWVIEHAYGRTLGRAGLDARLRELLAVASLVALGCWRPLASHLRGALRCGAGTAEVAAAIREAGAHLPASRAARALRLLERVAESGGEPTE